MGYCMHPRAVHFFIDKTNVPKALAALKELPARHYSWVNWEGSEFEGSFAEALYEWRWEATLDDEGNVTDLDFCGEKYGDDDTLWETLAPFVQTGSYIEIQGEDGAIWRWVFVDITVRQIQATVTFED